jgi:hypothetical protein
MNPPNGRTDELVAEAQRLQELLSAAAGELGAFVQQLRTMTIEAREEDEVGDG